MELTDYELTMLTAWNQALVVKHKVVETIFDIAKHPQVSGYLTRRDGTDVRWLHKSPLVLH